MKLKHKILLGYGIVISPIVFVGGWGTINLRRLGQASDAILRENYRSILAAENIIDAIERQDSAVLLALLDNETQAKKQFRQGEIDFLQWLGQAKNNITIAGEGGILAALEQNYREYLQAVAWGDITTETYCETIFPLFETIRKQSIQLREIDQSTMIAASESAQQISEQAIWSMAIAKYPDIQIIIISAHGTVDNAVEAMKLGAVDFLQKPFTPKELRNTVYNVLERENLSKKKESEFEQSFAQAKHYASKRQFDRAISFTKQAIGSDPSRAEVFNFLGELQETIGLRAEALKNYRVAIDLDPTYQPAKDNLDRATRNSTNARPSF